MWTQATILSSTAADVALVELTILALFLVHFTILNLMDVRCWRINAAAAGSLGMTMSAQYGAMKALQQSGVIFSYHLRRINIKTVCIHKILEQNDWVLPYDSEYS